MRAIFVARGPAFPHLPNSKVPIFQNIEVYNIICDTLGVKPHPNNGTLRLPLSTEGLHDDAGALDLETPHDGPQEAPPADEIKPGHMQRPGQGPPLGPGTNDDKTKADGDPQKQSDKEDEGQKHVVDVNKWWDIVHDQIEKAKEWAKNIIEKLKSHSKDG